LNALIVALSVFNMNTLNKNGRNSKTPSIAQQKRWLGIDVDHVKKDI